MRTSNPGVAKPKPLGRESHVGPRKAPGFQPLGQTYNNALASSPGHSQSPFLALCSLHPGLGGTQRGMSWRTQILVTQLDCISGRALAAFSGRCCSGTHVNPSVLPTCYVTCKMFSKHSWKGIPLRPIILIPLEARGQLPAHPESPFRGFPKLTTASCHSW